MPDTGELIGHVIVLLPGNRTICSHSYKHLILFQILLALICLNNILQYRIIAHCVEKNFLLSSLNLDSTNFTYCPLLGKQWGQVVRNTQLDALQHFI